MHNDITDCTRQDEVHLSALGLLVLGHRLGHILNAIRIDDQQQATVEVTLNGSSKARLSHLQLLSKLSRVDHSESHGMTVINVIVMLMSE